MPKSDLYLNFFIFKWRCKSGQLFKAKGSPVRAEKHVPRQKRRRFLLSRCELPPFRPDDPFALPLIAEKKQENLERFLPALFGSGACFLARAARKRVWATDEFGDNPPNSWIGRVTGKKPEKLNFFLLRRDD
jgi:hypothetical protein